MNLESLTSIKSLADDLLQHEERIDGYVLNAGIMALPNLEYTSHGFEKVNTNKFFLHQLPPQIITYHLRLNNILISANRGKSSWTFLSNEIIG